MNKQRLIAAILTIAFAMTTLSCSAMADDDGPATRASAEQEALRQRDIAERKAALEITAAHERRVLQRLALRHDADAEVLRLFLAASEPLDACKHSGLIFGRLFSDDVAADDPARVACQTALDARSEQAVTAILQAPDRGVSHLFAALGRGQLRDAAQDALRDELYLRDPLNPAVLAVWLGDTRWQPSDSEVDLRLWEVAHAGHAWRSYHGDNGKRLMQAMLSVPATPEMIELHREGLEQLVTDTSQLKALTPELQGRLAAATIAWGYQMANSIFGLQSLAHACDFERQTASSAQRMQACEILGQRMATQPETLLDQRVGARLWQRALIAQRLDATPAIEQIRRFYWLMEQFVLLSNDRQLATYEAMLEHTLRGESELQVWQHLIADAGLPLDPPPMWQPKHAGWDQPYR